MNELYIRMMNKLLFGCMALMLFVLSNVVDLYAQDGLFSDGRSLQKDQIEVAFQPVFLTEADEFIFFLRGRYGLSEFRDVEAKLGLLSSDIFFGAHAEEPFLESKEYNLRTYFQYGFQFWGNFGLKASYNIRYALDQNIRFYTGLLYQPTFGDVIQHPLIIPIGLSYRPSEFDGYLFFELNGGLNDDATAFQSVQLGFKMPFDKLFKSK